MKNLLQITFAFIALLSMTIRINAQIYTPGTGGQIQGSSGNDNVSIGGTSFPQNARLRVGALPPYGALKLHTAIDAEGFPPVTSEYALRINFLNEEIQDNTVFNIDPYGSTKIGIFPSVYLSYVMARDNIGVFSEVQTPQIGFGSITQSVLNDMIRIGWTNPHSSNSKKLVWGYGVAGGTGSGYNYPYNSLMALTDGGYLGVNIISPEAPVHIFRDDVPNSGATLGTYGLLIENNGYRTHDYALKIKTAHGDVFRFSNAGELFIGKDLNGSHHGGYKLYVQDGIRAERVRVDIAADNGWADYVFEEDYEMMSIEELEAYVKENKHLPGVPSEAEVVEDGIDLGEMNAILLKQIEELTLRMIEIQKEVTELKKNK
jgi:hypothetical protein